MSMSAPNPNIRLYNVPWETDEFNGMPYRLLGKSGLRVSNIGLGTWKVGYPETGDGSRVDEKTALQIFDRAVEIGVTFWDTANRYNNASGNSERLIGKWFKSNPDQRRNVILATKLYGGMDGYTPNHCRLSRINILESVYASLGRLNINTIDLLYFHAFDSITPIEESLMAVEDLIQRDLVRYFAVSNFTIEQLTAYQEAIEHTSIRNRITAVQNHFDILDGESKDYQGVMSYAERTGISFIAWSPLAGGMLTERYLDNSQVGSGDRLYDEGVLDKLINPDKLNKVRHFAEIAKSVELDLSQLTLAYMLSMPGMGPVIPAVSTVKQLEVNARAGKVSLPETVKLIFRQTLDES